MNSPLYARSKITVQTSENIPKTAETAGKVKTINRQHYEVLNSTFPSWLPVAHTLQLQSQAYMNYGLNCSPDLAPRDIFLFSKSEEMAY